VRSLHNQRSTAIAKTTQVAEVWLLSDGATICPTAASQGIYTFVVPSGRRRVGLESRFGASRLGDTRRLGVRVSEIAIRSNAGEVVIAADDPSLTMGWYDAERDGTALWRWTDGSAELPWPGVSGPAVVTVRCVTLSEYVIHGEKLSPCDCSVSWLQHC
jgi:hypothetical protein